MMLASKTAHIVSFILSAFELAHWRDDRWGYVSQVLLIRPHKSN
jgi:hypothetical protein